MDMQRVIRNLNDRGFLAEYCETAQEAKARALTLIGGRSTGIGGSATIRDLGLYEALQAQGTPVYWHWKKEKSEMKAERLRALAADVFLSSTNALLEDGRLVNIDGTGNRAAGLIFGPETVIMIVGRNKLVSGTVEDAVAHIKQASCSKNAQRLGYATPCALTGKCTDCRSKQRICRVTYVHDTPCNSQKAFHVLLVNEELGF